MDDSAMTSLKEGFLKMLKYAVKGQKLEDDFSDRYDLKALLALCKSHRVAALASLALKDPDEGWKNVRLEAVRRSILFDHERNTILQRLEEQGIWYCPLKGIVLKDDYPVKGIREMADNDILVDENKMEEIKDIMLKEGFSSINVGNSNHYVYHKEPIFNFEMHKALFNELSGKGLFMNYFSNISKRLIKDDDKEYGFHFSDEDFYIYFIAHNHKHFSASGSGVRTLADIWFFLAKHPDLDWDYIEVELEKLDLKEEEKMLRSITFKLFDTDEALTKEEQEVLDYIVSSGVYGNYRFHALNKLKEYKKEGKFYKLRYIKERILPSETGLKVMYPIYYKHVWARPFLAFSRLCKAVFLRRKKVFAELKVISKEGKADDRV